MMDSLTRMIRDTIQRYSDGDDVQSTPTFIAERIAEMLGTTFEKDRLSMIDTYSRLAARTIKPDLSFNEKLTLGAIGIGGEGGEVMDPIKKEVFHGKPFCRENMLEELGDVVWYVNVVAVTLGFNLSDVFTFNIKKLEERHGKRIKGYGFRLHFPEAPDHSETEVVNDDHCVRGAD